MPDSDQNGRRGAEHAADGFYRTLFGRRDVLSDFLSKPVASDVLARIFSASHAAPSVGLSQPWNFIIVDEASVKEAVHSGFCKANFEAGEMFPERRRQGYCQLQVAGYF